MTAAIELDPLPFPEDALQPTLSAASVRAHRVLEDRYVRRVNDLATGPYAIAARDRGLAGIIELANNELRDSGMFNAAAQVFNHRFWWRSVRPYGMYEEPRGQLRSRILGRYANFDSLATAAQNVASRLFGNGWLWLVIDTHEVLHWRATPGAKIPGRNPHHDWGDRALLCIDLWEHAYYLDFTPYRPYGPTSREDYVRSVLQTIANWEFAELNLELVLSAPRMASGT